MTFNFMLSRLFPILIILCLNVPSNPIFAQNIDLLFEEGKAAVNAANYTEAERIFRQVIKIDPNNADAYYNLGLALRNQEKLNEAIAAYEKAIQLNPSYARAYNNLGNALRNQGKLNEAIAVYEKAIQQNPNDAVAYIGLGIALSDQGKLSEAIELYEKAIQLNPNYADAYYNLGLALRNQGKDSEAIAAYEKAIQFKPNYALAYIGLGNALRNQGKDSEAIAAYEKAIEINPNYATAYIGLGNALRNQGKLEEAIAVFQKALNLPDEKGTKGSTHTLAHTNLGYALQQQGKLEEAIAQYEKALKIDPNYTWAQNNLKEAQRLLAIKIDPTLTVNVYEQKHIPSETDEPLVKQLRATARIIAEVSPEGYSIASGWVVKRSGDTVWIVTNRHVISDPKTQRLATDIKVQFFSELEDPQRPRYTATIEKFTEQGESLDLAVLKVSGIPSDIQPLTPYTGRLNRNTPVQVIGHPNALEIPWNTSSGNVMNYNPNNSTFPIDAYAGQGNSGGPVINEQKQIIGMMVTIRRREEIAIAYNPNEPAPNLDDIVPATGDAGIAYRIDIVMEKLQSWGILP